MLPGVFYVRQPAYGQSLIDRIKVTVPVIMFFCAFTLICKAAPGDTVSIPVSQIYPWKFLNADVKLYADRTASPLFRNVQTDNGGWSVADYTDISLRQTRYPHYFHFSISNDRNDEATFFFYNYIGGATEVHQTGDDGKTIILQEDVIKATLISHKVFKIKVAAHSAAGIAVRIEPLRDPVERIYCWLIPEAMIGDFFVFSSGFNWLENTVGWIVSGMLLMMLLYISIKYWQVGSSVYFYYAGYIFFFFLFFTLKNISDWNTTLRDTPFYYTFGYQMLQIAAYCMYFPFAQRFINTRVTIPKLHPWLSRIVWVLLIYIAVDFVLLFIPSAMILRWTLWDVMRILLLLSELVFTILLLRARSPYIRFLVIGSAMLAFFAMLSMVFTVYPSLLNSMPVVLDSPITYFYIGVVMEILFFSSVLGYKNRRDEVQKVQAQEALKREAERLQFQQYRVVMEALEGERGRIAKDLHDGLGGMLSGVKFSLSNIKDRIALNGDQDLMYERALDQLGGSIKELRRIAHDMMPDVLVKEGLSKALGDYCEALNSMQVLSISFQSVGPERRAESYREVIVYRITQELITNVIRHARATEMMVQIVFDDRQLAITVEDNGRGFEKAMLEKQKGMGLSNIRSRIAFLNGQLNVDSSAGSGTSAYIEVPI